MQPARIQFIDLIVRRNGLIVRGKAMEYPELRVSFHLRDEHDERRYNVELNCVIPGEAAEDFSGPFPIEFDWDHPDSRAVALTRSDTSDR